MNAWLFVAAINGFLAVALGAFAAHGLSGRIDQRSMEIFETAARYHMYHALAMGLAALGARGAPAAQWSAGFFLCGILLFSGSLYLFALTKIHALVFVTPIGGLSFLIGWGLLAFAATRFAS